MTRASSPTRRCSLEDFRRTAGAYPREPALRSRTRAGRRPRGRRGSSEVEHHQLGAPLERRGRPGPHVRRDMPDLRRRSRVRERIDSREDRRERRRRSDLGRRGRQRRRREDGESAFLTALRCDDGTAARGRVVAVRVDAFVPRATRRRHDGLHRCAVEERAAATHDRQKKRQRSDARQHALDDPSCSSRSRQAAKGPHLANPRTQGARPQDERWCRKRATRALPARVTVATTPDARAIARRPGGHDHLRATVPAGCWYQPGSP